MQVVRHDDGLDGPGTTRVVAGHGKVIIERLCISLPYVETFNSKVIKGFVPELRSRYVFFVFRDPYVLCICYIYEHYERFACRCEYVHFTYSYLAM